MVKLADRKDSKFSTYSLGMKQRLAIAAALLGDPSVLVFDEPTNGLDPVGITQIRELIKQLSKEGKTILLASHLLDEVEKVCTHVAILQKGQLLMAGDVNEVLTNEEFVELGTEAVATGRMRDIVSTLPGIKQVKEQDGLLQLFFDKQQVVDLGEINRHCFERSITLNHLQLRKKSLETKFMELTK